MPITLGSNIASLRSQRQLADNTTKLSKTLEKLSSGLRINRASDDAAGLAIADSLRASTKVSQVAIRNANDAISVVNIIDSTLSSQKEILTRMSEFPEQSANGIYSYTQRKALDAEYQSLIKEFDRIADTTQFNGVSLLRNSSGGNISFQVGTDSSMNSLLSIAKANSHSLSGVMGIRVDMNGNGIISAADRTNLLATGYGLGENPVEYFNPAMRIHTITDSNGQNRDVSVNYYSVFANLGTTTGSFISTSLDAYYSELQSNGSAVYLNRSEGVGSGSHTLNLTFSNGATATITENFSDTSFQYLDTTSTSYTLLSGGAQAKINSHNVTETAIGFTNTRTQATARHALGVVRNRMDTLSLLQGQNGAMQSRLSVAISNLSSTVENYATAESRIRDADIAQESAEMTRLSILQQASTAILAQANQQPALAIQLLGA